MEPQYTEINPNMIGSAIFCELNDKVYNEFLNYTSFHSKSSIIKVLYKEDVSNDVDELYLVLIINNKHSFLLKIARTNIAYTYLFSEAKIISYLGKDLTKEQIKGSLDSARLFG